MWRLEYIYEINKRGGGKKICGGWSFSKSVSVGSTFIREMRVFFKETQLEIFYQDFAAKATVLVITTLISLINVEPTLTDFEKFHPPQKKIPPPRLLIL